MNSGGWDARIRRANDLISSYPFAAEGLRFYARVATFQKALSEEIQKALAGSPKISSDRPLRANSTSSCYFQIFQGSCR
jgi:hypothetical protein